MGGYGFPDALGGVGTDRGRGDGAGIRHGYGMVISMTMPYPCRIHLDTTCRIHLDPCRIHLDTIHVVSIWMRSWVHQRTWKPIPVHNVWNPIPVCGRVWVSRCADVGGYGFPDALMDPRACLARLARSGERPSGFTHGIPAQGTPRPWTRRPRIQVTHPAQFELYSARVVRRVLAGR